MDKSLMKAVRNMYDLYETTTQLIVFLPREHGRKGVKRVSDVYRSTRVASLSKMLSHPQLQFKHVNPLFSIWKNGKFLQRLRYEFSRA